MRVSIYQINPDRDVKGVRVRSLAGTYEILGEEKLDASIYDEVFTAEIKEEADYIMPRVLGASIASHRGRPVCVSDVVVMDGKAFFLEQTGIPVSFEEHLAHHEENLLDVVYVEPHRKPIVTKIRNEYKDFSRAVEGLIENIYLSDGTVIVANDESKLLDMEGNRRINCGKSIIAGPFFVVGDDGEKYRSLTEEEINRYLERFDEIEEITPEEVAEDMWMRVMTFSY